VVHNHPSGDPTPSKADIAVTKDIVKAAEPPGVQRSGAGPVVRALERHHAVDDNSLGVREPRPIVYPDRHACRGQRVNPARPAARGAPIGDHLDINPALLGPVSAPTTPEPTVSR